MSPSNQHQPNWAKRITLGLQTLITQALVSTENVGEFIEARRTASGIFAIEPSVDEQTWPTYYDSPKILERDLVRGVFGESGRVLQGVLNTLRNPRFATEKNQLRAYRMICFLWSGDTALVQDEQSSEERTNQIFERFENRLDNLQAHESTAFTFYLWVYVPCWLVHGVSPTKLVRRLSGESEEASKAAEKLIRLDRRFLQDRKLKRWINCSDELRTSRQRDITKWLSKSPFDKPRKENLWLRVLAGYVSNISELLGHRLNSTEIRQAIESLGEAIPQELREDLRNRTGDDFSREIRRQRSHFELPTGPDTSFLASVRGVS